MTKCILVHKRVLLSRCIACLTAHCCCIVLPDRIAVAVCIPNTAAKASIPPFLSQETCRIPMAVLKQHTLCAGDSVETQHTHTDLHRTYWYDGKVYIYIIIIIIIIYPHCMPGSMLLRSDQPSHAAYHSSTAPLACSLPCFPIWQHVEYE